MVFFDVLSSGVSSSLALYFRFGEGFRSCKFWMDSSCWSCCRFDLAIVSDVDVLVWLGDVPFRVGIAQYFCSLVQL